MHTRHRQGGLPSAIDAPRAAFVAAVARGDSKAASSAYISDAVLLAPSTELLRGREDIEQFWRAGLDTGISEMELTTLEFVRLDCLAYEVGRYALTLMPEDGKPIVDTGKYVIVHEPQADGSWLWALEMFNPDVAPAGSDRGQSLAGSGL